MSDIKYMELHNKNNEVSHKMADRVRLCCVEQSVLSEMRRVVNLKGASAAPVPLNGGQPPMPWNQSLRPYVWLFPAYDPVCFFFNDLASHFTRIVRMDI